jgi:hypothetical protein
VGGQAREHLRERGSKFLVENALTRQLSLQRQNFVVRAVSMMVAVMMAMTVVAVHA